MISLRSITKIYEGRERQLYGLLTVVGAIGAVVCYLLFIPSTLLMADTSYNIWDFQFAFTAGRMDQILTAWAGINDDVMGQMAVDLFFPIFYGMFLGGLSLLVVPLLPPRYQNWSRYLLTASVWASFLDEVENIFSIYILSNPSTYLPESVLLMSVCASLKYLLIILVITSLALAGLSLAKARLARPRTS